MTPHYCECVGCRQGDRCSFEIRVVALEAALEKYGSHLPNCPRRGWKAHYSSEPCDCGFNTVFEVEK